jgi:hypothetical protein
MKEYLRSDGDTLTIPYIAPTGTDSVVFNVYDLDLEDYIQSDEGVLATGSTFNLILDRDVALYDRRVRIEVQSIDANTYTEDEFYGNLVRPYATAQEIAEYGDITIVSSNPGPGEATLDQLVKQEKRARLMINSIINDAFVFKYKSIGTIGQGTDLLYLGQRIESFDKIIKDDELVYDSTEDPAIDILEYDLAISSSKYNLKVTLSGENISEWTDVSVLKNHGFFEKNSSYIIRGEYGWKYIPVDINQATCELASDMICSDYVYRKKGVKSIKNDAYSIEFTPGSATGNLIADNLIAPYKRFDIWAV